MKNLIINEELKTLLPPLSAEEFAGLEESILKDGCLSPLIVWNDTIVDGHYRYEICTKHQIPFSAKSVCFESLEDAKLWIGRHQEGRRNLTQFHKAELALKLKDVVAAKAKQRQGMRKPPKNSQPEDGPIDTRKVLSEMAGVSTNTLSKVEFLMEHASPEVKEKLRKGEKGTSIHREYMRLRPSENPESLQLPFKEDKPNTAKCSAEELSKWLLNIRSAAYVRELILRILCDYKDRYGSDEADAVYHFLRQSYNQQQ